MNPFSYTRAHDLPTALDELQRDKATLLIAGGTNLIDLMKAQVTRPGRLVDINHLPLKQVEEIPGGGLRIGALVTNSDVAYHPEVEARYPLLSKAILAGASAQLRNMATTGGNLMQRTRCYYFYDTTTSCNKREPGTGCAAMNGFNRIHAILGASEHCIATHPSDMCVALAALDAVVRARRAGGGERGIPFAEFYRLPEDAPQLDTTLLRDELITAVDLPAKGFPQHYAYVKVRDRESYAFALVSVATALELVGEQIIDARLALGGVAHIPWRDLTAEARLRGQTASRENFLRAAEEVVREARGYAHNAFKIELAKRAVVRALEQAAGMEER